MNIVLLQEQLSLQEIELLLQEFPQYLFLSLTETSYKNITKEHWNRIEILFGSRLTYEELLLAQQLRWIHISSPYLNKLCMKEIVRQGNIIVTTTAEENIEQIGEYVEGAVLSFAKNLFAWSEAMRTPSTVWDNRLRESMWSMGNRIHLQIGLENVGTEITKRMSRMHMKVWGVMEEKSFHPYCNKIIAQKDLHSVLPAADVVCLALPRGKDVRNFFTREQLELMKSDAIFVVLGPSNVVNHEDLVSVVQTGKLRGVVLDPFYEVPISLHSPLWNLPRVLITPEVSPRPKTQEHGAFRVFLFNLRQYLHGNYHDMRNVVDQEISEK